MTDGEPIALERRGWDALSRERAAIVDAMSCPPWSSFELQAEQVLRVGADAAIVAYGVAARRGDDDDSSSVYVRRAEGRRLAFHQQTPR